MSYNVQTIPEKGTYLSSTIELSTAIDEWLSKTPDIIIISINTISSSQSGLSGYAAIVTYNVKVNKTDQHSTVAC